eukprot:TRINITY_DN163_c0_g1_i6.p1 TRINITY_DN163_c0_g1~~TRINITY_DN163_c0_g1_i6.p1  ORF type:complete len:207 (-),score=34.83 TRINITY_DN163_c0_g1_i6:49-669(-)
MELAGLSIACAIHKEYPPDKFKRAVVLVGPGNNGGDGLVAARHLFHFGYMPSIILPRAPKPDNIQARLVKQLHTLQIPISSEIPSTVSAEILVDAVFGFSFSGAVRAPYDGALRLLKSSVGQMKIVAVDIPSGWDVERGNVNELGPDPDMLISLSAPKTCAKFLRPDTLHYLGGRFVPPSVAQKYQLSLPPYAGAEQCVRLPSASL